MRPLGNKRAGDSSVGTEGLQIQAVATARVRVCFYMEMWQSGWLQQTVNLSPKKRGGSNPSISTI